MSNRLIKNKKSKMSNQEVSQYFDGVSKKFSVADVQDVNMLERIENAKQLIIMADDEEQTHLDDITWDHPEFVDVGEFLMVFPHGISDEQMWYLRDMIKQIG